MAVVTKSASCSASSPAATIRRAAAASASRRSPRRVVPAWSASPRSRACRRMREASARTTPAGTPATARSRLWSMCSSRNPRSRPSHSGAPPSPDGSTPSAVIASASATPSSSRRASTSSRFRRPTSARLPNVGVLKRPPSSSANDRTATGRRARAATSKAAATPSAPSKRPPPRTLSRCEPSAHHGGGASGTAHRLPAGSRCTRRPVSPACAANHSRAAASSGVQASRVVPSAPRPIGSTPAIRRPSAAASITAAPASRPPGAGGAGRRWRTRTAPDRARACTGRARPAHRARARRRACRPRASRRRPSGAAPRRG